MSWRTHPVTRQATEGAGTASFLPVCAERCSQPGRHNLRPKRRRPGRNKPLPKGMSILTRYALFSLISAHTHRAIHANLG